MLAVITTDEKVLRRDRILGRYADVDRRATAHACGLSIVGDYRKYN